jgi:hypothetical protein
MHCLRASRTAASPSYSTPSCGSHNGTLPPDFPDACGTVYIGDLNVLITQTLTDFFKVSAGAALRDAAAQVNACMARAQ